MADSPFKIGSEIEVKPFLHATPLVVEILSTESFDHGGSAKIFKGLAKVPYQPYQVALKVISHVVSKDRSELVRRELEIVTRLSERSMRRILPFIGTASIGFHPIIVMEYMKNGNMVQYFQKNPTVDRQGLLIQVSEAVYWLHEFKNLVHGDLKCENVLINDNEDAVLADFGLSTLIEQEATSVTTCTDIRNMNTFRFAAPELLGLLQAPEPVVMRPRSKTPQSDVYAFGMLVLQHSRAFTGKHPWPHLTRPESVLLALMSRTCHPRPSEDVTRSGLTDKWWDVCKECWEYEPCKRPTMHAVWDILGGYMREDHALPGSNNILPKLRITEGLGPGWLPATPTTPPPHLFWVPTLPSLHELTDLLRTPDGQYITHHARSEPRCSTLSPMVARPAAAGHAHAPTASDKIVSLRSDHVLSHEDPFMRELNLTSGRPVPP